MVGELPPWTVDWWRPIETAPYGHILGWVPFEAGGGSHFIIYKDEDGRWYCDDDKQFVCHAPTHWMPLPPEPRR